MNNAWLEAFITVKQTGSVSKAAELLFLTQPTITNRIQSLEAELGLDLFYRSKKKMTLTQAGTLFYPYALSIIDEWNKGKYAVQQLNHSYKGELSVAVFYSGIKLFSPLFIEFSKAYPDIKLTIKTTHSEEIADLVANHIINVGFTLYGKNETLENRILYIDEYVLVANSAHPLTKKSSVSPQELKNEKFLHLYSGGIGNDYLFSNNMLNKLDSAPKISVEVDNLDVSKKMLESNMGLALLPKKLIEEDIKDGHFATIPIDFIEGENLVLNHYLVWLKSDMTSPIQREFINFVLNSIQ